MDLFEVLMNYCSTEICDELLEIKQTKTTTNISSTAVYIKAATIPLDFVSHQSVCLWTNSNAVVLLLYEW